MKRSRGLHYTQVPRHILSAGTLHQLSETFEAESGAFTTTIWGTTHKGLGAPKQLQSVTKTIK